MSNQYQNAKTKMSNFVICIFDLGFHLLFELFPALAGSRVREKFRF